MHEAERADFLRKLHADRFGAHEMLFKHQHEYETPWAHKDLIEAIHDPRPRYGIEGFRGVAKTTRLEEAVVIRAGFQEFRNLVILGPSYERACERLISVKRELEHNDKVGDLFGRLRGPVWQEGKITLKTERIIQAVGRDQKMTGMKWLQWRPDAAMVDDVEDPEEVRTDAERDATWRWFLQTFLPSLSDSLTSWVRVLGTRRGVGSLPERIENIGWPRIKIPIEYIDEVGERRATWPAKMPLDRIDQLKRLYRGNMHLYMQEYMCQAASEADRVFGLIPIRPQVRSWQMADAVYDPGRSRTRRSATTGWAVASWYGDRLVVWDAGAEKWLPSEMISHMFETNTEHHPRWLAVEEDGLSEWVKQPIRAEMVRRRELLPLLPVRAPREGSKISFIGGLQSFQIEFAKPCPELQDQLSSFPTGSIDAPNALAYFTLLKPGLPVYDNFGEDNIVEGLQAIEGHPLFLAGNADGSLVTAALLQRAQGEVRILADWVREGSPLELVSEIHAEASLLAETGQWTERVIYGEGSDEFKLPVRIRGWGRHPVRWVVPAKHQERYANVGLVQAIRGIPQGVSVGERDGDRGGAALYGLLGNRQHGRPRIMVSPIAQWTLRAFAGGYSRSVDRRGLAAATSDSGLYQLLMEGIEAFCAVGTGIERVEDQQPVAYTRSGIAYKSAMPERGAR